ncbi:MAG TPA: TIGR03618 family F420-dependent PPOX class oxidoreductase [Dehalococcoidia bacterium]|jgi:PPOX class probable F420-dependent enzyme|nr:TIGR03618 family F420-dependent PPOX class oxidoreductase [Dehalococcoidia bacterium]
MSDERDAFLQESHVAVLATVDRRGRAHAAPIWYLYDDGVFIMSTGRGSQKHRNIEGNPEVTLVIDQRTLPYYALMARGAVEIGPPLSSEDRLRIVRRYLNEEQTTRYMERMSGQDSISLRLKPRKMIEFTGRAGRRD